MYNETYLSADVTGARFLLSPLVSLQQDEASDHVRRNKIKIAEHRVEGLGGVLHCQTGRPVTAPSVEAAADGLHAAKHLAVAEFNVVLLLSITISSTVNMEI